MKLLVNGCSFSRGPSSWPYRLQSRLGCDLVNLSQAGAGNTYIQETTVAELAERDYDFVIVMWSGLARIDFRVEDISRFKGSIYTSQAQKSRNDWPDKIIHPVNDQDYVADDWVFGCGILNNEPALHQQKFLDGLYRHLGPREFSYHGLQKMIALQSFLKTRSMSYCFCYYDDYIAELKQHQFLFDLLDKDNMIIDDYIDDIAKRLNSFDIDASHPGTEAHDRWAEILYRKLFCTNQQK